VIAGAQHEDIMGAGIVQGKNNLVRCDEEAEAGSQFMKMVNIFNSLDILFSGGQKSLKSI
jgi:hypothetical protein